MGNLCCKPEAGKAKFKGSSVDSPEADNADNQDSASQESSEERSEREELEFWREELNNDLHRFVINNVLLGVQFFKNFDEDIEALRKEAKANDGIPLSEHRMRIFQADKLMDRVGQEVSYQPKHGPQKMNPSLLHPLRTYVVYDNVAIVESKEVNSAAGKPPKAPFFKLQTESPQDDHLENSGYVNLIELESQREEGIYESIEDLEGSRNSLSPPHIGSPRGSGDSDDYDIAHLKEKLQKLSPRKSLTQMSTYSTEEIYPYSTIQRLTEKKQVHQARRGFSPDITCSIPRDTFTKKEKFVMQALRRTGTTQASILKRAEKSYINYLNSAKFSRNFLDVLAEKLSEPLKIAREVEYSTVQAGRVVINQGKVTYQIMPVLPVPFWPKPADKFFEHDGREWPTKYMKRKIYKFGVYARPLGFLKRRGENPDFELQWRYICPRAEEYLLLHTMHAHIRCYLFTVAIFKSFLNPEDFLGLNHTHVLHLLFKELHANFYDWPDEKPGETLLLFLKKIYKATEMRKVQNFFIKDRNMLESSPIMFLNKAQGLLSNLVENPLPFLLVAVKNLKTSDKFYPRLDVTYIYKLTTAKKVTEFLNPGLVPKTKDNMDEEDLQEELEALDLEAREVVLKGMYLRNQQKEKAERDAFKGSTETINVEEPTEKPKRSVGERERRRALLEILIPHFIAMGSKSCDFRAFNQARMYFLHARRLNQLLPEVEGYADEIESNTRSIEREQARCDKMAAAAAPMAAEAKQQGEDGGVRLSSHMRDLPKVPDTP